jgi:hypothetical protein
VGLALQDAIPVDQLPAGYRVEVAGVLTAFHKDEPASVLFFGLPFIPQRLQATSFYTNSPQLRGYFTARQWYALCDFRVVSEHETALALRLALLVDGNEELSRLYGELTASYDELLARADDGDVRRYLAIAEETLGEALSEAGVETKLAVLQTSLQQKLPDPMVNDQYLSPTDYARFGERTKGFRLLPPRRIPSAVLLQRTVDPAVRGRMIPSAVDFFAVGPLASDAARRAVRLAEPDADTADAILAAAPPPLPESLHGKALKLISRLQDPVPEAAPAALRTEAWHDKQLSTQLAAWAEQRHTWALHTKLTVHYACASANEPGVVSPYPEFFEGLAALSRDTADVLARFTQEDPPDTQALAKKLLRILGIYKRVNNRDRETKPLTQEEWSELEQSQEYFGAYAIKSPYAVLDKMVLAGLEAQARRWAGGEKPDDAQMELLKLLQQTTGDIPGQLREFADLCRKLAAIARKQLAGDPLTEAETLLLHGYGEKLAAFHFYGGNSYVEPRDDLPICTPIFLSPILNRMLYAAEARPEALYVVVKVGEEYVLHRGAVLSYREFHEDPSPALTDESWRDRITAGNIPAPPPLTQTFRPKGEFTPPK